MESKVELHIGNNSLLVEGSENFVKEQVDVFYDYCSNLVSADEDTSLAEEHMTPKEGSVSKVANVRDFYSQFSPSAPAESAQVLAGWIYTQRGSAPFDIAELKGLFDEVGAPSPQHLDMTIRNMQRDNKKLFQSVAGGMFRPTVHGENYFKSEMKLNPGTLEKK